MARARTTAIPCIALFVILATTAAALPALQEEPQARNAIQTENNLLDSVYQDCLKKDTVSCLKYKVYSFVDKVLGHKDTITLTEGVQLVKTNPGEPEGAPRTISNDDTIESVILSRVTNFLSSHTLKIDVKGSEIVNTISNTARSLTGDDDEEEGDALTEEGRGKKKKAKKVLGPLMALAALKAAFLGKLALAAIALIAGKALLIGKLALVLSAIIGLKKLLGGQGKHVSYEVVAHPTHSSSHITSHESVGHSGGSYGSSDIGGGYGGSSGHGGWGRSLDAQQLAYRAHIPSTTQ